MTEELLESLLNTIKQPALLMDKQYQVVACNQAYSDRYQFQQQENQQVTCYQVSHGYSRPCDEEGEACPLKKATESKRAQRVMHIHNTPQGKEHIDVQLQPIFDANGELSLFLEILQEVNKTSTDYSRVESALIGQSTVFNDMLLALSRAANSDISVLLLGESGTGKELAARFLHENSSRQHKPFVTVECAGLSDTLFESELFGHVKGAFTGASQNKKGLVAVAEGGTLFLDELGDIPLSQQIKLLRLLETGIYRQVGSTENRYSNFRLITATNKNLEAMVAAGEFREDLYYRQSSFPVYLPALRERGGDVILIAKQMLQDISGNLLVHFSDEALAFLSEYDFPGNIRQLKNMVERANILRDDNRIELNAIKPPSFSSNVLKSSSATKKQDQIVSLQDNENQYLLQIARQFTGSKAELAEALGVSERTLFRKLKELNG